MKATTVFTLVTAGVASAIPTVSKRQGGFDRSWDDEFIPIPQKFEVRNAGSRCAYQLAYERFSVDNRYGVRYYAEYADGSQKQVGDISGGLAQDQIWLVAGLPEDRALEVVYFGDSCQGGATPVSFETTFALTEGFTYENRYTTGSIPITVGGLPSTPQNVAVRAAPGDSTVTWNPVAGVSSYVVMVEWLTGTEVGPRPFVWAREVTGTSFQFAREFTRAAVIAIGAGEGDISTGAKAFTRLDTIRDAFP